MDEEFVDLWVLRLQIEMATEVLSKAQTRPSDKETESRPTPSTHEEDGAP